MRTVRSAVAQRQLRARHGLARPPAWLAVTLASPIDRTGLLSSLNLHSVAQSAVLGEMQLPASVKSTDAPKQLPIPAFGRPRRSLQTRLFYAGRSHRPVLSQRRGCSASSKWLAPIVRPPLKNTSVRYREQASREQTGCRVDPATFVPLEALPTGGSSTALAPVAATVYTRL